MPVATTWDMTGVHFSLGSTPWWPRAIRCSMPTSAGGSCDRYQADSGLISIVSTLVTMIDIPSRHAHSVRRSVLPLSITIALNASGLTDVHAPAPVLGDVTTL